MHANREDAPSRPQKNRKAGNLPLFIGLGFGVLVSAGVLMFGSNRYHALQPGPAPVTQNIPASPATTSLPAPHELPPAIDSVAVSIDNTTTQPSTQQDSAPLQKPAPAIARRQDSTDARKSHDPVPAIRHQTPWKWERQTGSFLWLESNTGIDWSSVCSNYPSGSQTYLACRNGAKRAFADACRHNARSPACAAASHYKPQ